MNVSQDDQDTCRICSAPAEPDAPLFHPCKCSGTIRYIHQDCLTTWLAHSKKKTCDVCKYQYSFKKVYAENMPDRIPFVLFLRKFAQQLFWAFVLGLRGILVAVIWLMFLPYVTVWTWRFYFIMGENVAWWINDRPRPTPSPIFRSYFANVTVAEDQNKTTTAFVASYPVWRALSSDIFTGQMIAVLIVLVFLGVFLLREWIMQNARPGVFEDDDLVDGDNLHVAAHENAQPPVPEHQAEPQAEQAPDNPAGDPEPSSDAFLFLETPGARPEPVMIKGDVSSASSQTVTNGDFLHNEQPPPRRKRRLQSEDGTRSDRVQDSRGGGYRTRSRLHNRTPSASKLKGKEKARTTQYIDSDAQNVSGWSKLRKRSYSPPGSRSKSIADDHASVAADDEVLPAISAPTAEFTFAMERSPSPAPSSTIASSGTSSPSSFSFGSSTNGDLFNYDKPTTLPYPIITSSTSEAAGSSTSPRRPPLPSSSVPTSEGLHLGLEDVQAPITPSSRSPSVLSQTISLSGQQPLSSPNLATYQAPEELSTEAGPSGEKQVGYFDDQSEKESTVSVSSTGATAAQSIFREELDSDEYFRDESEESDMEGDDAWEGEQAGHPGPQNGPPPPRQPANILRRAADDARAAANAARIDRPDALPPVRDPQAGEPVDDPDAINDEDVDGALEEAIGMRGPLTTMFQNAALMIFVLDTTIGLAIWLPFTIGKTLALLSREPFRIFQILHLPIRTIRLVTDPVVDTCFFLIRQVLYLLTQLALYLVRQSTTPIFGEQETHYSSGSQEGKLNQQLLVTTDELKVFVGKAQLGLSKFFLGTNEGQESAVVRGISHVAKSPVAQFLEPQFVRLGKCVRLNVASFKSTWVELAIGDASINRFFAIVLGYTIVGVLVALYLNVFSTGNMQNAGKAIRNAIRQQLIVTKVATFIIIELILFPLGCGIMLDLCTFRLFPSTTLQSRLAFFAYAPVTSTFYHWMSGTMFMYQFAVILSGCRKIMRTGAMWFIKDPQDQNFHPIRDILERPTLTQLRKLAVSAVMYSIVVALGMSGLLLCLRLWGKTLLPLRWKLREPLSDVPIDLLFLHIIIPPSIRYFRPRRLVHSLASSYWRWAARQLRLTSYMFGERPADEMYPSKSAITWVSTLFSGPRDRTTPAESLTDGSFRRVPAQDNISLPRDVRATVEVDKDGKPIDEAGQHLMDRQNAEAVKARHSIEDDYVVVYLPPHFRERMVAFVLSLWLVASLLSVAAVAIPIHIGRAIFWAVLRREVHDGYSLIVGAYILWGCFVLSKTLDRMDKRRQRYDSDEPRGEFVVYVLKRGMVWIGGLIWVAFWLGIVVPILMALVMEVFIIHPLRLIIDPDFSLGLRVLDLWAVGLIYTKMALYTMRMRPETSIDAAIKRMKENSFRRLNAAAVTVDIIVPLVGGLCIVLVAPVFLTLGLQRLLPKVFNSKSLFLYVYPGIFVLAVLSRLYILLQSLAGSWAQQIRDSEFLVEMRLRNLEPAAARKTEVDETPVSTSSTVVGTPQTSDINTEAEEAPVIAEARAPASDVHPVSGLLDID